MSEWTETTIGDFCPFEYGSSLKESNRYPGTIPVYGSNGIVGYHNKALINTRGVIIGRKGTVGAVHYSNGPFFPIDTTFFVSESQNKDIRFIYYLLKSLGLEHMNSDSAVPGLNRKAAHSRIIRIPESLNEQRAIAGILGALDDKIELNRRMNRTLESMARAVFRRWFVENEEVASWKVGKLSKICTTQYGFTASASDEPIGPKFLRITDMNKEPWIDWANVPYCEIENNDLEKYKLRLGDILVSRIADPGKAGIIEEEVNAVFASYLVRLKFKDLAWSYFAYYFLRSNQYLEYAEGAKSGSVQSGMNAKVIAAVDLRIPPDEIVKKFFEVVKPFRNTIVANLKQSRTLASLRDSLLPKLMRGEVRVKV